MIFIIIIKIRIFIYFCFYFCIVRILKYFIVFFLIVVFSGIKMIIGVGMSRKIGIFNFLIMVGKLEYVLVV